MYDGMVFGGKEGFVRCAEGGIHYGVCAYISICLKADTTHQDYVEANFPSDFYRLVPTSTLEEMIDLTFAGECNVIAYERNVLLTSRFAEGIADGKLPFLLCPGLSFWSSHSKESPREIHSGREDVYQGAPRNCYAQIRSGVVRCRELGRPGCDLWRRKRTHERSDALSE